MKKDSRTAPVSQRPLGRVRLDFADGTSVIVTARSAVTAYKEAKRIASERNTHFVGCDDC